MIYQGFVGPSYTARSPRAGIETSMNWFVERMESPGAKMPSVLLPTPGVEAFATLTDAPVRGIFGQADRVFAVGGETLFEILEDGTVTNRGAVVSDSNPVTFAANGDAGGQIALTSGGKLYIFTLATNVFSGPVQDSTATDIKATSVAHMSGYFLAFDNTASKVTISDLNDGLTWDALQYFQRTRGGDPLVAMDVKTDEVWIWGEKTSEAWFNSGASPMPFEPISGAFFEHGMAAPSSVARVGTSFIWLASSAEGEGMVMQSSGFQPTRISTHAVEQAICTYAAIADAVAFTYQDDGHIFYVLNFPTAKATWVFDQTTGLWHERGTWDTTLIVFDAWRPQYHATMWTKHLVGDRKTGAIFHMSSLFYKDVNAQGIRRVRRAPHLSSEERRMFYNKLQVDMDVGEGLTTGQGSDPQVMLRVSDDGGRTWGSERWASAGKIGEYKTRVIWFRLGSARDRVFEVSVSDPIPWRLVGAYLDVLPGLY
jgi:hypothetical protein